VNCGDSNDEGAFVLDGYVFDASHRYGTDIPVNGAQISVNDSSVFSDSSGFFELEYFGSKDPIVEIIATGFTPYEEKASRMVNGAFHLIPSGQTYEDFSIINWGKDYTNPQNWHRKWNKQTEFYIIQNGASDEQIKDLITILKQDEYLKMTGGLYSSNVNVTVLNNDLNWNAKSKNGKTKIYFADGIISGGIGHSEDNGDGIIDYAEIGWDTHQEIDENIVWHELSHTVAAGGHINYREGVNSETLGGGYVYEADKKVFNCIYNSPPKRNN
jgi:hypothetical protein